MTQQQLEAGVFEMPADEYHATDAWGSTSLRQFAKGTPREFYWKQQQPDEPTDAMKLGTAIHTAILEPHLLESTVAIWTGARRAGAAWDAFKAENAGKVLLTQVQGEICYAAASAITEAKSVYQFLQQGDNERSYFAQDPETGLWLKTRPDNRGHMAGKRFLVDVKTIRDLDGRTIIRSMADHGYGAQAAHYCDVVSLVEDEPCEDFFFLFVKNSLPVDIRFMQPDPEWVRIGRERNRAALRGLAECIQKDEWPGYPVGREWIPCPEWAKTA